MSMGMISSCAEGDRLQGIVMATILKKQGCFRLCKLDYRRKVFFILLPLTSLERRIKNMCNEYLVGFFHICWLNHYVITVDNGFVWQHKHYLTDNYAYINYRWQNLKSYKWPTIAGGWGAPNQAWECSISLPFASAHWNYLLQVCLSPEFLLNARFTKSCHLSHRNLLQLPWQSLRSLRVKIMRKWQGL